MIDTREKLREAKYFLERMIENQAERDAFKYNLSAFLSAARSVTFVMQKEFDKVPGFAKWYSDQQVKMRADEKMKILTAKRDMTIHQKSVSPRAHVDITVTEHITMVDSVSVVVTHADGTTERCSTTPPPPAATTTESKVQWRWYFDEIPDMDVITVCREYISKLESIVADCERLFNQRQLL